MALKLTPIPSSIQKIRLARQLSLGALAVEANVEVETLKKIETEATEISKRVAFSLAGALAVPVQFLFSNEIQVDPNIPDFRTTGNRPAVLTSSGIARLARARSITSYLTDDVFNQDQRFKNVGTLKIGDLKEGGDLLAGLYVPIKRPDGTTDPTATFRETRVALEKKGIIVLCDRVNDGFRGFCYATKGQYPIIFINTTGQRPATKLFTLVHEMVHVLLGRTGISDPGVLNNDIERFCNKVAASVMMPASLFREAYGRVADRAPRSIANYLSVQFGASKQAAALRVTELGIDRGFYSAWASSLPSKIPPIEEEDEGESTSGGGGSALKSRGLVISCPIYSWALSRKKLSPHTMLIG